jgi:uncharacterized protein YecE (DUF72 family)
MPGRTTMGRILVGTSSWTDPTLVRSGRFYPERARSPEDRLRFYASQFDIVEVDSTYYSMPAEETARLWVERTPANFVFDIKAFRLFTHHPTPVKVLPRDLKETVPDQVGHKTNIYQRDLPSHVMAELWNRFESALLPLDSAMKLGAVLFQFPPWFYPGDSQRSYMLSLKKRLPQYRIAVEFRHGSWLNEKNRERTLSFLRDNDLAYVCVDEPQGFPSSVPPVVETTSDNGLLRFHGRNTEMWERKDASAAERFNYLYSDEELQEWVPRIRELSSRTTQLHVLFNNCYQDKAVRNAQQIRLMLD